MKEIIVLGGGFAGVSAGLLLKNKFQNNNDVNITLIDRNSYHLFTPSLYEVATSEEPKKNIAIPLSEIFPKSVKLVKGEVSGIDMQNKLVRLSDGTNYSFDYLIVALGSESAYYDIDGLKKYSFPLKTLQDAVKINRAVKDAYSKVKNNRNLKIVIGGGGFAGTELTAEIVNYRNRLVKQRKLTDKKIDISVIQGSSVLLKELDEKVSEIAQKRLQDETVRLCFGAHIKKVDEKFVYTDDGKKYAYDILIWTGGVKASPILKNSGFKVNGRGQIDVDDKMRILNLAEDCVYAVGDNAEYGDPVTNRPVPGVAEVAEDQGRIAAENIFQSFKSQEPVYYKFKHLGYIIPLKGKFAVAELTFIRAVGFLGWIIQQFVFLYYLLRILSFSKAFKKWNKFEMYLMRD